MKEKIDRKLVGQSPSTPFMNIEEGNNSNTKVVSFDIHGRLDDKIGKPTSMRSKLTAQGSNQNRPFKSKIYQGKGEDKLGIIIIKIDTKADIDQTVVIGVVE